MVEGLQRVVVTGLGAVTPIGNTVADYWEGLTSASNGVEAITLFDAAQHACRFAAEVKNFDPSGFIEPKEAKRWDRFCKFGVVAAKQALADSGLTDHPRQCPSHWRQHWLGCGRSCSPWKPRPMS